VPQIVLDLQGFSALDLLRLQAEAVIELRRRKVVRSSNNPVADYAEGLAARALGFDLATRSTTGHDGVDKSGVRYEVKARRPTSTNASTKLSFMRGLDVGHFDYLVGILFHEDFSIARAALIPLQIVREIAKYRDSMNAWDMHLRDSVWGLNGVDDITGILRAAARNSPGDP
jgi:hypothetical protein